jgi:hypothetical protein
VRLDCQLGDDVCGHDALAFSVEFGVHQLSVAGRQTASEALTSASILRSASLVEPSGQLRR